MIAKQEVANIAQQNNGILFMGIVGILSLIIVVKKFKPPNIEEVPKIKMLKIHIISPLLAPIKLNGG
jgi:hypothetical protein